MKVSLSFLKTYLKTSLTVTELADKMTAVGLEVEEVTDTGAGLTGIVIGEIIAKEKHPNADRLNVLRVNSGSQELQIVCGAPNCYVGMKSALALPGVMIPQYGEKLETGMIRGIQSFGMMCSERELCLGDNHEGILDIKTDAPAGTSLTDVLKSDIIFDVNVTPNRGDCFGVYGIARDLAAAGAGELIALDKTPVAGTFKSPVSVRITDGACSVFAGRYIRGVKNQPSPQWLQALLLSVGMRPISALVDVTNYFNIGLCRPLHVFDAKKLTGNLTVRSAQSGEQVAGLDEKTYTLSDGMLVVADDAGAQSIAGIMGGTATGCDDNTTDVFLESAMFSPLSIAATARTLNAESDSKVRFERGVDAASAVWGNEMATRLILDLCGGEASELVVAGQEETVCPTIEFDFNTVERLCGLKIEQEKMVRILTGLGFGVQGNMVTVPSFRANDVKQGADLVEEIVRINGLDDLPDLKMRPRELPVSILMPAQRRESAVRRALAEKGLNQAMTWSFMDSKLAVHFESKGIKIANPIASDLDEMRPSLIPNLLSAVARNQDRGIKDVQLFEVGPEFYSVVPGEQRMVAAGVRAGSVTPRHFAEASRVVDVFDAKADALAALAAADAPANAQVQRGAPAWYHPGRSGRIALGRTVLAYFGEIHPKILKVFGIKSPVAAFEVYLNQIPEKHIKSKARKLLKMSSLMPVTRDFAFVMDAQVDAGGLINAVYGVNKSLITDVKIFDVYEGDKLPAGQKSIALEVTIQPVEKTLTDSELEVLSTQIINLVKKNCGAELRR